MDNQTENTETSSISSIRDRALSDLSALARDAETLVKVTAGDVGDRVKEARNRVAAAVEHARTTVNETQTMAFEAARSAAQRADTVVRGHPYESIGVTFGLGLIIGVLVARR